MKLLIFILIFHIFITANECFQNELLVDPRQLITDRGYPAEKYTVRTSDGYLLSLYRIPHGRNGTETNKKPILLNHGLSATCGCFISLSPNRTIGFVLADNGYDVWLMNTRGNIYSNRHINIPESNKRKFYDFTFHEIGYYDIPANIDFILEKTNQTKLYYFGHSQGGTTFLVMGATRPEYNAKIRLATVIGPTYEGRNTHALLKLIARYGYYLKSFTDMMGVYDYPFAGIQRTILHRICKSGFFWVVCAMYYDSAGGYANHEQLDQEIFSNVFLTMPSTVAVKQANHYLQCLNVEKFQEYDYGILRNVAIYGTSKPPLYNMSKITAPVSILVGVQDHLMGLEDSEILRNSLPNVVHFKVIDHDGWNHGDFLFAKDVVKYVYTDMLNVMSLY